MNFNEQMLSLEDAKKMDMVDYLSKLGYEPVKVRNVDYWYLSPLRNERTPSFKINRRLNRWYDHGQGKGGNLIDFAILYHGCTVSEFLKKFDGSISPHKPVLSSLHVTDNSNKITVLSDSSLSSFSLLKYLEQRKIPRDIADQFCREVRYKLNKKICYGIGFENDSGGFEIRNPYFKCGSAPKDITTINNGAKNVQVFEGFIDFLSFVTIHKNEPQIASDFVVLNSVSFFEKARSFMEKHEAIRLYLDNDRTGQNYSRYALSLTKQYKDESSLYNNYKDLNEWLVNFGKEQKQKLGQKLR